MTGKISMLFLIRTAGPSRVLATSWQPPCKTRSNRPLTRQGRLRVTSSPNSSSIARMAVSVTRTAPATTPSRRRAEGP